MFGTGLGSKALGKEAYDAPDLIRRLFFEQAWPHRRRYAVAFLLMAFAAAGIAIPAKLVGDIINKAYEHHEMSAIVTLSIVMAVLFMIRGFATYGHTVILTRIGVRIIADNQRRLYDKLLNEGQAYFAQHHSADFLARLTAGGNAAALVINIVVSAVGRDLLQLIGLVAVMIYQDAALSLISLIIMPPALIVLRRLIRRLRSVANTQFQIYAQTIEATQETVQGIVTVKAFTLERFMRARIEKIISAYQHEAFKQARIANRASPLMESLE